MNSDPLQQLFLNVQDAKGMLIFLTVVVGGLLLAGIVTTAIGLIDDSLRTRRLRGGPPERRPFHMRQPVGKSRRKR